MLPKMNVTVMMDVACIPEKDPEFTGVPPDYHNKIKHSQSTEHYVVNALRGLGHQVRILSVGNEALPLVEDLTRQRPDMVFNLTEIFRDDRRHDMHIAALLEMLEIPFTGTGSTGLLLCRDKALCKRLLGSRRIRIPGFAVIPPGQAVRIRKNLRYPMVVKPIFEDGSEGISNASLVRDSGELLARAQMIHENFSQPAIAEEFVEGRELYVSLLGNKRLTVLPAREISFGKTEDGGPVMATYHVKWNEKYQKKWNIKFMHCELSSALAARVARVCRKAYRVLHLQDFGRIDLRITPDEHIVVLEANPNPDIACGDEVAEAAAKAGIGYLELIDRIMRLALRRCRGASLQ